MEDSVVISVVSGVEMTIRPVAVSELHLHLCALLLWL